MCHGPRQDTKFSKNRRGGPASWDAGYTHGTPGQAPRFAGAGFQDDLNPYFPGNQGFDITMGPCVVLSR